MKYKHAGTPNEYYTIYDNGLKSQSWNKKDKPGLFKEMMDWVDDGNTIELQYTVKELAEKEAEDSQNAINSQRSTCIQLLNDSEKSVSNDPPYPDDIELWKISRQQWRDIIKGNVLSEIPKKPF